MANCDGSNLLHHTGSLAGSMFAEAPAFGDSIGSVEIETDDAATFLNAHLLQDDFVRVKFNVEGAEILIIDSLRSTGLLWTLECALIDFDSEKIEGLSGRSYVCGPALRSEAVTFYEPPESQYGWVTNYGDVREWLLMSGAKYL